MWERAGIVAVGDEVLTGEVINTNGAWLAAQLMEAGSRPGWQAVVPDDEAAIAEAVRVGLQHVPLLVLVGGLGPTPDDRTRSGVARGLGVSLAPDPEWAARLEARHGGRGASRTASIQAQSQRLAGATRLENQVGTAPGQLVILGEQAVALLPGPPAECRSVAQDLLFHVRARTGRRVVRHTWRVYDLTESELAHRLGDLLTNPDGPRTGLYVRPGVVEWRVEMVDQPDAPARYDLDALVREARRRIQVPLYDDAVSSHPGRLLDALAARGETVAVAESLTGGLLSQQLTSPPGASAVVMEGRVVYTEAAKVRLGVPASLIAAKGVVSHEVAVALAEAARAAAGTTWGLGLTGYAGPSGGDAVHPPGTYYVGLAGPGPSIWRQRRSGADRDTVRAAAAETARHMLALALAD